MDIVVKSARVLTHLIKKNNKLVIKVNTQGNRLLAMYVLDTYILQSMKYILKLQINDASLISVLKESLHDNGKSIVEIYTICGSHATIKAILPGKYDYNLIDILSISGVSIMNNDISHVK